MQPIPPPKQGMGHKHPAKEKKNSPFNRLRKGYKPRQNPISRTEVVMVERLSASASQRQLVALHGSQHHDQQREHLKTAVDALEDVWGRRYAKGNPKNVRSN